ncbi:Wzz/FepE/Etk N-terminal domain-containing protein [Paenibacillus sp. N1-5-1-14]|uniref:YveK family protein n=1 Tax=Paenibacillus radicibacter TaxID=2972488 RepID=UPI002159AD7B|nr:Wzz/FepE/Etk N-terminal domain-containing protein [Paenibacillus radicibacter]MCR8641095.1 Wzz/FepE/Etk N-terminal domain-containing protein [Paenibacillus radicibacter]
MDIELKTILRMFKKRFWLIALIVFTITSLVGAYFYLYSKPTYEASTKIIVNKTRQINGQSELNAGDVETNMKIMGTYKDLMKTEWMMKDIVSAHPEFNLGVKDLIDKVSVSDSSGSQVMTFSVKDRSYERAVQIVNAVTKQFYKKIPELIEVQNITILNEADAKATPDRVGASPLFNVVIAFIVSFILGIGLMFLLEHLDDTIKSERDIEIALELPTLAIISKIHRQDYKPHADKHALAENSKVGDKYATN